MLARTHGQIHSRQSRDRAAATWRAPAACGSPAISTTRRRRTGPRFGTINRGTGFEPLLGNKGAQFDATKFNWIGSTNNEVSVCVAWHTTGIAKFDDLLTRELVVGATGPSADTYQFPKITNAVLGTKFKIVTGYPGGNDVDLAMERGEVAGRCGWSWTSVKGLHQPWLDRKEINILYQMGLSKHRDLPDIPLVIDLARTDEERAILKLIFARQVMAWPFLAPPGTPGDRVEALRKAFMQTMQDKDFLAEADKAGLEITPVAGEDIQKLVAQIYATPAADRAQGGRSCCNEGRRCGAIAARACSPAQASTRVAPSPRSRTATAHANP